MAKKGENVWNFYPTYPLLHATIAFASLLRRNIAVPDPVHNYRGIRAQ